MHLGHLPELLTERVHRMFVTIDVSSSILAVVKLYF